MKKRKVSKKDLSWTPERLQNFAQEIDEIRQDVFQKLGSEDAEYANRLRDYSKKFEIAGRALIFASIDPLTWMIGVISLALHKQLETTEIGHYALHGAWDQVAGAEKLHSKTFKWDTPIEEESWKHGHNILHHQFTNIMGKDPDFHYSYLRMAPEVPWFFRDLFQLPVTFAIAPFFTWFMNPHFTGISDLFHPGGPKHPEYAPALPDRNLKTLLKAFRLSFKKATPYLFKNFIFWPALAGFFFPKVLVGNLLADMLRDIYTCASIFPGHLTDDSAAFPINYKTRGRGEWYKSQVESTNNYDVPKLLSVLCGALNFQIEHHLFPKLPPNRLREIAPRIEEVCKKHGVDYRRASWVGTWKKVLRRVARYSLP